MMAVAVWGRRGGNISGAAATTTSGQLLNCAACSCLLYQVFAQRSAARFAVLRWAAVP
jgi:hypothetical protein